MEVALIIGMFLCTALSLNFLVNGSHKLSGTFDVINLCLIVATAYQFKLINSVIMVVICVLILIFILSSRRKNKANEVIQARIVDKGE